MKIFKNEKDGRVTFATGAYKAAYGDKPEVKTSVIVNFSKGCEPAETVDGDLKFVAKNGKTYNVFLSAYQAKDGAKPVLVLTDKVGAPATKAEAPTTPANEAVEVEDIDIDFE